MDEEYLLGLLLEIVKQSGVWLLEERGQVAPYGISIVGEHGEPASFFPEEHHPGAPFSELLALAVAELRTRASEQPPFGVALVTALSEGPSALSARRSRRRARACGRSSSIAGWWTPG